MFTIDELKNILALISLTPITGKDAMPVAILQDKIQRLLSEQPTEKVEEVKKEKK